MTFTSWSFAVFTGAVLLAYYTPSLKSFQVQLLVLASVCFYGIEQPALILLLLVTVLGTYAFLVLALQNRRLWLPVGITFNLGLLAFFKYKFLFVALPVETGNTIGNLLVNAPLPIGISFFVFHNISLLVDLTKSSSESRPKLNDIFLYIIFFPQLVSGPITRAQFFMPQISPKYFADVDLIEAAKWIIVGYFFKLFVANNLNEFTAYMAHPTFELLRLQDRWLLVFLYSAQIYADFFGYSSIAIGLGLLFGYRLADNFNLPYRSKSFSEFWSRWHISLSLWLRNYLYIPLGGNRHGSVRTCFNLLTVMALGGLWHGAGLSYLVWGFLHGIVLVIERPFLPMLERKSSTTLNALRTVAVFTCVSILWIFFKLPSFDHAAAYLTGMFTQSSIENPANLHRTIAIMYCIPVILQHYSIIGWFKTERIKAVEPYFYGAMIALAMVEAGPETSFIYFQF